MTICILGGTGFIGRHLCQELHAQGLDASVISRNPDRSFLSQHAPGIAAVGLDEPGLPDILRRASVLIDLASASRPASSPFDPSGELTHAGWMSAFLTRLRDLNPLCHVVFASSGGQIYGAGHLLPIAETAPAAPATAYAFGKLTIENMLAFLARSCQLSSTVLRIANPAGRWQLGKGHGLVAAAIRALDRGEMLTIFGDGGNVRDYFDADELAALLARFGNAEFRPRGVFNIGSGIGLTELDVVAAVESASGRSLDIALAPARSFDLRYAVLDVSRARAEIGWSPRINLAKTIGKLLERDAVPPD